MSTKNLLDSPATSTKRPDVFDDLTGKVTNEPRLDISATLLFLHEAYTAIATSEPKVNMLAKHYAVSSICYHMGWFPSEIAVAEQYVAQAALDI